jgi:hypothetical protein
VRRRKGCGAPSWYKKGKAVIGRLIYFVVQFTVVVALTIGGSAAYIIHDKGMTYARSPYFLEDLQPAYPMALIAAGLVSLVWICYQLTKKSLEREPFDPDTY